MLTLLDTTKPAVIVFLTKAINWRQRAMCGIAFQQICHTKNGICVFFLPDNGVSRFFDETYLPFIPQRIQQPGKKERQFDRMKKQWMRFKKTHFAYLWNAWDSIQIQRPKTMKCHMVTALQSYAFACHDLDRQPHQFDSIWQMANIVMHCECDRRGILPVQARHPIGMVLLHKWK